MYPRTITVSVLALIASAGAASAFPATAVTSLNVRAGPGTGYGVVDQLQPGQTVEVVARNGGWYQIEGGGWASGNYFDAAGSAAIEQEGSVSVVGSFGAPAFYYGSDPYYWDDAGFYFHVRDGRRHRVGWDWFRDRNDDEIRWSGARYRTDFQRRWLDQEGGRRSAGFGRDFDGERGGGIRTGASAQGEVEGRGRDFRTGRASAEESEEMGGELRTGRASAGSDEGEPIQPSHPSYPILPRRGSASGSMSGGMDARTGSGSGGGGSSGGGSANGGGGY